MLLTTAAESAVAVLHLLHLSMFFIIFVSLVLRYFFQCVYLSEVLTTTLELCVVCCHAQENQIMLFTIRVGLISNFGFKGRNILNYNENVYIRTMEIGSRLEFGNVRNNGNFRSPVLSNTASTLDRWQRKLYQNVMFVTCVMRHVWFHGFCCVLLSTYYVFYRLFNKIGWIYLIVSF